MTGASALVNEGETITIYKPQDGQLTQQPSEVVIILLNLKYWQNKGRGK
jgi:hypothetical protein